MCVCVCPLRKFLTTRRDPWLHYLHSQNCRWILASYGAVKSYETRHCYIDVIWLQVLVVMWRCSCISYFEQFCEYDPFITPPECFSPWISDTTEFWEQETTLYVRSCRHTAIDNVRQRSSSVLIDAIHLIFALRKLNLIKLGAKEHFGFHLSLCLYKFLLVWALSGMSPLLFHLHDVSSWLLPTPTTIASVRLTCRWSGCLFFSHDISKTDAARITKHDIRMLHDESWKPIYFGIRRSKMFASHKNSAGVGLCTLMSAGF